MSREYETYRLELEQILDTFGNKRVLSVTDVVRYTGRSENWCRKNLKVDGKGTTATNLALKLSRM